MPTRACIVGAFSAALALLFAPAGRAVLVPGYSASPDWSGYVAGEKGIRMDQVSAGWTVPRASCNTAATAFSEASAWVGLGDSSGIEQIGPIPAATPTSTQPPLAARGGSSTLRRATWSSTGWLRATAWRRR